MTFKGLLQLIQVYDAKSVGCCLGMTIELLLSMTEIKKKKKDEKYIFC